MNLIKQTSTGNFYKSAIANCPVFVPYFLGDKLVHSLSNPFNTYSLPRIPKEYDEILKTFFYKFLAGDKCLKPGFADINAQDLFLWKERKVGSSSYVKKVIMLTNNFDNALLNLDNLDRQVDRNKIIDLNKKLRPKGKIFGIRRKQSRIGDPKTDMF